MRRIRRLCLLLFVFAPALCGGADAPVPLPAMPPRPGADARPTKVGYAVWLADIMEIDSVAQTFSASFLLATRWHDAALAHPGPGASGV